MKSHKKETVKNGITEEKILGKRRVSLTENGDMYVVSVRWLTATKGTGKKVRARIPKPGGGYEKARKRMMGIAADLEALGYEVTTNDAVHREEKARG